MIIYDNQFTDDYIDYLRKITVLYICQNGMNSNRINSYLYVVQHLGMPLNIRFKVNTKGVTTSFHIIESLLGEGLVGQQEEELYVTNRGIELLDTAALSYGDWKMLELAVMRLYGLSVDDLRLYVITDIFLKEVEEEGGANLLNSYRSSIEKALSNICSNYTKAKFNDVVKFFKNIDKSYNQAKIQFVI